MTYSEKFAARLCEAMSICDISAAELSRQTNITESMICRYRKGIYTPKRKVLLRMAEVLRVSSSWLEGESDILEVNENVSSMELTPAECDLMNNYRHLTRNNRELLRGMMKLLLSQQKDQAL